MTNCVNLDQTPSFVVSDLSLDKLFRLAYPNIDSIYHRTTSGICVAPLRIHVCVRKKKAVEILRDIK